MAIRIKAVYENGVLVPSQPLPLPEHEQVLITIDIAADIVRQTAGMIPWTGGQQLLRKFAEGDELDPIISP